MEENEIRTRDPWTQFHYTEGAAEETHRMETSAPLDLADSNEALANIPSTSSEPFIPSSHPPISPSSKGTCPFSAGGSTNANTMPQRNKGVGASKTFGSRPGSPSTRSLSSQTGSHPLAPLLLLSGFALILHSLFPTLFLVGCGLVLSGAALRLVPLLQSGLYARLSPKTQMLLDAPLLDTVRHLYSNMTLSKTIIAMLLLLPLPPDEIEAALDRLPPLIRDRLLRRTADLFPPAIMKPPTHLTPSAPLHPSSSGRHLDRFILSAGPTPISPAGQQTASSPNSVGASALVSHLPSSMQTLMAAASHEQSLSSYLIRRRINLILARLPPLPSARFVNTAILVVASLFVVHIRSSPMVRKWAQIVGHFALFAAALVAFLSLAALRMRAAIRQ
eukprot:TRINITY_DN6953_c0_g1_i1.p1 TRINITY_DN6953_c0_g1~~TRINITY_DN6953_c0_g1_i1.p1  ORF type:complete len:390 (+),score=90.14 TRINITY_DN6953_c0_g1_i1:77-1246(+)